MTKKNLIYNHNLFTYIQTKNIDTDSSNVTYYLTIHVFLSMPVEVRE